MLLLESRNCGLSLDMSLVIASTSPIFSQRKKRNTPCFQWQLQSRKYLLFYPLMSTEPKRIVQISFILTNSFFLFSAFVFFIGKASCQNLGKFLIACIKFCSPSQPISFSETLRSAHTRGLVAGTCWRD